MELKLKIINLLAINEEKRFTINEIANYLKEHYSFVHRIVNRLAKEGVISKEKIGQCYLCTLNKNSEKTKALAQLGEIEKKEEYLTKNKEIKILSNDFISSLETEKNILSIVLFGSYAKGLETKQSDIDILMIAQKKMDTGQLSKEIHSKYNKEINLLTMTPKDFQKNTNKAIISQIIGSHYILKGTDTFVSLMLQWP